MDFTSILVMVIEILAPILLALLWIHNKVKNKKVDAIMGRLNEFVYNSVELTEKKLVAELKKGAADGKLTKEDGEKILSVAVDSVKGLVGKKGLDELQKILGLDAAAINKLIVAKIETEVAHLGKLGK